MPTGRTVAHMLTGIRHPKDRLCRCQMYQLTSVGTGLTRLMDQAATFHFVHWLLQTGPAPVQRWLNCIGGSSGWPVQCSLNGLLHSTHQATSTSPPCARTAMTGTAATWETWWRSGHQDQRDSSLILRRFRHRHPVGSRELHVPRSWLRQIAGEV